MIRNAILGTRLFLTRKGCLAPRVRNVSSRKIALNYSRNGTTNPSGSFASPPKRCFSVPATSGHTFEETIYALSTAPGRAAIAVVRISGHHCLEIYRSLCPDKKEPKPRQAIVRTLRHPSNPRNIIDSAALILHFPAPNTVTGEDVLELHIHGGPATQKAVLAAIGAFAQTSKLPIRYAEPGEFTRRAFQNDKLDLGQVEALSDALCADTEQQRRAAVRGNSGSLGKTYEAWRNQLLYARGELEALIDFSEDQHFDESPKELLQNVTKQVEVMLENITRHEAASQCGELLKRGIRISLLGPPNAGKSSLLNQIVGREASIVSHEAGTTRDIVEVSLDIRGYLCSFADTAGLRVDTEGAIELEGIRRAKAKANESDVVVAMASLERENDSGECFLNYDKESLAIAAKSSASLIVLNKADPQVPETDVASWESALQLKAHSLSSEIEAERTVPQIVTISCQSAKELPTHNVSDPGGIHFLVSSLVEKFQSMTELPVDMEDLIGVTERQRQLLSTCSSHLLDFKEEGDKEEADIVLAAEHLRFAATCLARITGRGEAGDVEEVLGVVFEKFCVGK